MRDVYAHPERPGYLIKVFNDRKLVDASQGVRGAARFVRPHYPYDDFVREQNEYTRCVLLGHKLGCRVPIAEIATVTLTDLGPGQRAGSQRPCRFFCGKGRSATGNWRF